MDNIRIENLEVFAHHGVFKEENNLGQKFVISAVFYLDTVKAGMTDDLSYSLNYSEACFFIKKKMEETNYKLLEAVVENLAKDILLHFPLVREVELTLKKPWAPILLPLETVSVTIRRKWHRVFLSIGSNLGDKEGYLDFSIDRLNAEDDTKVINIADYIETEPYGDVEQDNFLNSALEIETMKSPEMLMEFIGKTETEAGRKRLLHWGPRTLDIDILFFDDLIMESPKLIIPHPEIEKRDFVLRPMTQIAPYFRHPISQKSMNTLLEELKDKKGN